MNSIRKKENKIYSLRNFKEIPQIQNYLTKKEIHFIEVVGSVLPFKVNNYIINELINWNNIPYDPIFQLTFPQKNMLSDTHFKIMEKAISQNFDFKELNSIANSIRDELNPHPAGQLKNIPTLDGIKLTGLQHKYNETVLFFPSASQTCHAYCTYCFRWPQFVGNNEMKFSMNETNLLANYIKQHTEVTDILFTGGDPMVMYAKKMETYIEPLINHQIPNLQTIRIGTKSLSFWPYKFLTDNDADDMLRLFEKIVKQGYHLAIMAHFSHPQELQTEAVQKAIKRILLTGAQIRTQAPIMKHINDNSDIWRDMWNKQVKLGCIPYYMFIARDTGAQEYFALPLKRALNIYKEAYQQVSGIARTARGPCMSDDAGKIQILGINELFGQEFFTLQFIQGRNAYWVKEPFFAKYNCNAIWIDELEPAFGIKQFFFENKFEIEHLLLN